MTANHTFQAAGKQNQSLSKNYIINSLMTLEIEETISHIKVQIFLTKKFSAEI